MYENMMNFTLFISALILALSSFGCMMAMIGNYRFQRRWDKVDYLCDRKDALYMEFIREGWIPPKNHSFRGLYNVLYEPAMAMAA